MPSGLRETSKPQFEIYYEQPWGGVASDKDPVDIAPNQMVTQEGVIDFNNTLCSAGLAIGPEDFIFHPVHTDIPLILFFSLNNTLYGVDYECYIYSYNRGTGLFTLATNGTPPGAVGSNKGPTDVQIIDSVAYISVFNSIKILKFDIVTYTLATSYTAGQGLGVLTDYLLAFNTNNATDGEQPARINWSGPGKFSTWDPSVDRTAGFNTLPAVEEALTAFFSLSSVGLLVSTKSVIQLSPTGVAIAPFTFTELWTSDVGQGCIYPKTASQYGLRGYFFTDTGAYFLGAGSPTDISGSAKRALLSSFQPSDIETYTPVAYRLTAAVVTYFFNSSFSSLYYILVGVARSSVGAGYDIVLWYLDLKSGTWCSARFDIATLINRQWGTSYPAGTGALNPIYVHGLNVQTLSVTGVLSGTITSSTYPNSVTLLSAAVNSLTDGKSYTIIADFQVFFKALADELVPGNLNLVFRAEEIKLARKPTIRRIVIKAYGQGTLVLSVSGVSMGSIVLDGTLNTRSYESTAGIYTGEAPQLTITSTNFKGSIIKVMMAGTYADGDID